MRTIRNAFEAYVFLQEHPKFRLQEREQVTAEEAKRQVKGTRIVKDACGFLWREWRLLDRCVIKENFDIHYARVDSTGKVNSDDSKNTFQACWLEFGEMKWGYHTKPKQENCPAYVLNYHDIDLDCGAPTFDDAIVKLAKLVRKKFGDFPVEKWQRLAPQPRKKSKKGSHGHG